MINVYLLGILNDVHLHLPPLSYNFKIMHNHVNKKAVLLVVHTLTKKPPVAEMG